MKINVSNINDELVILSSLIEELEDEYLNGYHLLNKGVDYWKDNNSKNYFKHLNKENNSAKNICSELLNLKDVYTYLVEYYSKIGNNIFFDETNVSGVLSKFDDYINSLQNILDKYNELNLEIDDYGIELIKKQIVVIKSDIDTLKEVKEKSKKTFDKIVSFEKRVKEKISKINIEIIKESDINEFL